MIELRFCERCRSSSSITELTCEWLAFVRRKASVLIREFHPNLLRSIFFVQTVLGSIAYGYTLRFRRSGSKKTLIARDILESNYIQKVEITIP